MPSIANKVVEFGMSLVSDKLKKRIFLDKNIEELKSRVNPDLLPSEYGGKVSMADMVKEFKETLRKNREKTLALDGMFIDLDGPPAWLGNDDADIEAGVVGSFRKLEVD